MPWRHKRGLEPPSLQPLDATFDISVVEEFIEGRAAKSSEILLSPEWHSPKRYILKEHMAQNSSGVDVVRVGLSL